MLLALTVAVALLTATGCFFSPKMPEQRKNDLKRLGVAFIEFSNARPQARPAGVEDLAPYFEKDASLIKALNAGDIVFNYGVSLQDMANSGEGTSNLVLAYEKDAPSRGGFVLMADASVRHMLADEFKAAKQAKAEGP
jgi:hypothetical protein